MSKEPVITDVHYDVVKRPDGNYDVYSFAEMEGGFLTHAYHQDPVVALQLCRHNLRTDPIAQKALRDYRGI